MSDTYSGASQASRERRIRGSKESLTDSQHYEEVTVIVLTLILSVIIIPSVILAVIIILAVILAVIIILTVILAVIIIIVFITIMMTKLTTIMSRARRQGSRRRSSTLSA